MNFYKEKVPNLLSVMLSDGKAYSFYLDFKDGEDFGSLIEMFSNPTLWYDQVLVAAGAKSLDFIPFAKIIRVQFTVQEDSEWIENVKKDNTPGVSVVTAIGIGKAEYEKEEIKKNLPDLEPY